MKRIKERLFLAVEFCFSALLLIMALLMDIRLTAEKESINDLKKELEALEKENVTLTTEYEGLVSLEEIERYATQELGMQTLEESQIIYFPQEPR